MCPTVLAGQAFDLQESPENIVLYLIRDKWPLAVDGYIPAKSEITFSLFGWSGRKSYQISVEPSSAPLVTNLHIGRESYLKYNDPILVHVWILKNRDEVPPQMHHITQKTEQIILENIANVGYGITAIRLLAPFSAVELTTAAASSTATGISGRSSEFPNPTEVSLWHSTAIVELFYFRVTTGTLSSVKKTRTHKYNVTVEEP